MAKDLNNSLSLSKSELFALPAIQSDSYFSVQANVKSALVVYDSQIGNQKEILRFDLAAAAPSAGFNVSSHARDSFLLERIILEDFDGGTLTIERSALPAGLDLSLIAVNWTGAWDNFVTYSPGMGVTYQGNRWVMFSFIGAAGYAPASSHWLNFGPA